MKKFVTAAIAAVIASSSLGLAATGAAAQSYDNGPRGPGHEQGQDRRHDQRQEQGRDRRDDRGPNQGNHGPDARQDYRHDRRDDRRDDRYDRHDDRQDQRGYGRYQRAQHRYNAGRWQQPRGYRYQVYGYGQRLPSAYNAYEIRDYGRYGLRAPPRGYHYVRNGDDVVLAAIAGGLITAVIAGMFN